ncbi:MAG: hypothetical protein ABW000_07340 [Actinoplanes sp.]
MVFEWYGEVEFLAELNPEVQLEEYSQGARMAHYNSREMVLRLGQPLDAAEYTEALTEASAWVSSLAVTALTEAGKAAGPIRFTVESRIARSKSWAAGTKEAAELVGVSPTRLRQLEGAPGFPAPLATPASGKVYREDEMETYARDRQPGRPGRPPRPSPDA